MHAVELKGAIDRALDGVLLLDHKFYKRWECGHLSPSELTDYASQYRHFEAALPGFLRQIMSSLPEGKARDYVAQNLADEAGEAGNASHLELFDGFVDAVDGSRNAKASPAMSAMLDAYAEVATKSPAAALGGLIAYETQSPAVAASKGSGLREHYGLTSEQTAFWDLHAELDVEHSAWALEALSEVAEDLDEVTTATRQIAQSWWAFLDEREALAATGSNA